MKVLFPLVLAVTTIASTALATSFQDALARADERPPVVEAQLVSDDARRNAERTQADPFALRLDLLQARQAVEQGARALDQATFEAYARITQSFTTAVAAERQVALAELRRDLTLRSLEIARIRLERGSATPLDVQDAETELARAENDVVSARQGWQLALDDLASLVGIPDPDLEPVPPLLLDVRPPDLAAVRAQLNEHPTILRAAHGLEVARVALDLLDPSYASRAQIEQAELQVQRASEGLDEARRGIDLQAQQLHDAADRAVERLEVERTALADAREREALQAQRLEAGLIAAIALDQARLARVSAELSVLQAEHDVLRALFDFQAGTVTPLEGIDDF